MSARITTEQRDAWGSFAFAVPALLLLCAVFIVPLGIVVRQSVLAPHGGNDLTQFVRIFSQPMFRRIALGTLEISLLATAFALLLAYPLAYYLSRQPARRRAMLTTLVLVPFWTSALVKSFAFVVLLGHSGVVNTMLGHIGVAPVSLLFNRVGVIIGMSHYLVPFMMFPILSNLLAQPTNLPRAAAIMGAGKWRIFWRVTLPLSFPAILSGCLLVFIFSLGFYVVPALLGGLHDMMMSNMVSFYTSESVNWPLASAISVLLTLVAGGVAAVLAFLPGGGGLLAREDRR